MSDSDDYSARERLLAYLSNKKEKDSDDDEDTDCSVDEDLLDLMAEAMNENSEDEGFHTRYGYYAPDEKDPQLVTEASTGNLGAVKQIIENCPAGQKIGTVNGSRKWTEVQEKHGYDKSWEWHGDTALIAAARAGHVEVVKYLLHEGADPTLKSCPTDDEYETAEKAAEIRLKQLERSIENLKIGTHIVYERDVKKDATLFVREILDKLRDVKFSILLLKEAGKFWKSVNYSGAQFNSGERAKAFVKNPSMPTNQGDLIEALDSTLASQEIDHELLVELVAKYSPVLDKKILEVNKKQSKFFSRKSRNEVQVVGSQQGKSSCKSSCKGSGCTNAAAKACANGCCLHCCAGNCARHAGQERGWVPPPRQRWMPQQYNGMMMMSQHNPGMMMPHYIPQHEMSQHNPYQGLPQYNPFLANQGMMNQYNFYDDTS